MVGGRQHPSLNTEGTLVFRSPIPKASSKDPPVMEPRVTVATSEPSRFEKFGLYYLDLFSRGQVDRRAFESTDAEISRKVAGITAMGVILSSLVGIIFVYPIVLADLKIPNEPAWNHYLWVGIVTIVATLFEFYFLFYISLRAVHQVSGLVHLKEHHHESLCGGLFAVRNLLARAALEIEDPELRILGIDPFKRISRKNLLVLGLLYKGKIIASNLIFKAVLRYSVGSQIFGFSILYIAIPVEIFWNSVVIRKVIHEARLRVFGYALAGRIADAVKHDGYLEHLSHDARNGCLRAIGNAVVMTQNYHPNMVILLLRFQELMEIREGDRFDDWTSFLETLNSIPAPERFFLLDLLTVAAAFDGKLSKLERTHLREAYQDDREIYMKRLRALTHHLKHGRLNAAYELCQLDCVRG